MTKKATVAELQAAAHAHALEVVRRVPLGLPADVDEQTFGHVMDTYVQQLVIAWGAGWEHGQRRKGTR